MGGQKKIEAVIGLGTLAMVIATAAIFNANSKIMVIAFAIEALVLVIVILLLAKRGVFKE